MKKQGNSKQNQVNQNDFQHRNLYPSSLREYAKEVDDCVNSPSAWIYKGGKTLQDLCRPFMGGPAIKSANKSDASVASWRQMAAKTILSSENLNSDDENDRCLEGARGSDVEGIHHQVPHPMYRSDSTKDGSIAMTLKSLSCAGNLSIVPDEPRIVAPNVSKLSPRSVVEIRLQSINECVAILCSVDVLKMRSSFFYEVLNEQEEDRNYSSRDQNEIWRNPLVIPEISPFEAAAFLESLHEGRAVFKGEWVYCWARLSVAWQIQDLVLEYAAQIDNHLGNLLSIVKTKNWRTNPNILIGARVAVFRKSPTLMPTVLTGIVIEAVQTTGYSKLRVLFDETDSRSSVPHKHGPNGSIGVNTIRTLSPHTPILSPTGIAHHHSSSSNSPYVAFTPRLLSTHRALNIPSSNSNMGYKGIGSAATTALIGDVGEPIWVQLSHPHGNPADQVSGSSTPGTPLSETFTTKSDGYKDTTAAAYSSWSDPDDVSLTEIKKFISVADKRTFWEMSRAIIELPEIAEHCKSGVRSSKDLIFLLKNPEYKVLWTAEAADILPKQAAADLVTAAYVPNLDIRNRNF